MPSNSSLSSVTACPVTVSPARTSRLQQPAAPFLLINAFQPQTAANTDAGCKTNRRSAPPSLHQTEEPPFANRSFSTSHLDVPHTPIRVASQPSCPPAPKRPPLLRLYAGYSTTDNQGQASNAVLPSRAETRHLRSQPPAASDDTAALRQLMEKAKTARWLQDMLYRLRPDALKATLNDVADQGSSLPSLAVPMPGCLVRDMTPSADQGALQSKRLKLFRPARTTNGIQSTCTEALSPARSQRHPPTAPTDPLTAQTDPPSAQIHPVRPPADQFSGLPAGAVPAILPSETGVRPIPMYCQCVIFLIALKPLMCSHQAALRHWFRSTSASSCVFVAKHMWPQIWPLRERVKALGDDS